MYAKLKAERNYFRPIEKFLDERSINIDETILKCGLLNFPGLVDNNLLLTYLFATYKLQGVNSRKQFA